MDSGLVVVALLGGIALATNSTISWLKTLTNRDWNGFWTHTVVTVVGIVAVVLTAHASLTSDMVIPAIGRSLGSVDTLSHVLLGWILTGSGKFAFKFTQAVDGTQSAAEANLLPPATPPAG
jgi:hypothetical protein